MSNSFILILPYNKFCSYMSSKKYFHFLWNKPPKKQQEQAKRKEEFHIFFDKWSNDKTYLFWIYTYNLNTKRKFIASRLYGKIWKHTTKLYWNYNRLVLIYIETNQHLPHKFNRVICVFIECDTHSGSLTKIIKQ